MVMVFALLVTLTLKYQVTGAAVIAGTAWGIIDGNVGNAESAPSGWLHSFRSTRREWEMEVTGCD